MVFVYENSHAEPKSEPQLSVRSVFFIELDLYQQDVLMGIQTVFF